MYFVYEGGHVFIKFPDGREVRIDADGGSWMKFPDGHMVGMNADGTAKIIEPLW